MSDLPNLYVQRFAVHFEYPVHFTGGLFEPGNPLLRQVLNRLGENRRCRCAVYVDSGVAAAMPDMLDKIKSHFSADAGLELSAGPQVVPGGEAAKTGWQVVRDVIWTIGNAHLDRQSYVIIVGGGGVLDMVGFAASIIHRGLRVVRVPTTTLAQADAGVGVKTGMDEHGAKNFVGTFAPPFAVINDFSFLPSLPQDQWLGGVAEAFKVAIIKDAGFFAWLCENAARLRGRELPVMETLVRRTAIMHLEHIAGGGDPFEFGAARPLDFGHWSAHRLESLSGYRVGHGMAVSAGVALDSCYACRQGLLTSAELEAILNGMRACGLPIYVEELSRRTTSGQLAVLEGLEQFREHLGGALTVTLPKGIGRRIEVHEIDAGDVEEAIEYLRGRT